jgi:hypothetical protein
MRLIMKLLIRPQAFLALLVFLSSATARIGDPDNIFRHSKLRMGPKATSRSTNHDEVEEVVNDEFIFVLDDDVEDVTETVRILVTLARGEIKYIYKNVFKGAAVTGIPMERLRSVLDDKAIKYATPVRISLLAWYQEFVNFGL